MNVAFYIKLHAANLLSVYIAHCEQIILSFFLNLNITVYIKDQYENTKYSRTFLHTKSSLYLSQVNCIVIEHTT